jgi:hypothetical protein
MVIRQIDVHGPAAQWCPWHCQFSECASCHLSAQAKLSDAFSGKVVEVVSGDCLMIKDASSGLERRVQLSRWAVGCKACWTGVGRVDLGGDCVVEIV